MVGGVAIEKCKRVKSKSGNKKMVKSTTTELSTTEATVQLKIAVFVSSEE